MSDADIVGEETGFGRVGRWVGLALGPAIAVGLQLMPPPEGLSPEAWRVVSLSALMVVWWVTEAIPISATALLLAALPLLAGISMKDAASPYADPIVFLFIGGFILAACVERWRLHERIALSIASVAGGRPAMLVAGFMLGVDADLDVDFEHGDDFDAGPDCDRRGARDVRVGQARSGAGRRVDVGRGACGDDWRHRHPCWHTDEFDRHRVL